MNTRSVLIAAVCLVLSLLPTRAHERLQGPTEVLYWDKAQTYTGYTFFGARSNTYLIDMEGRVAHQWPVGTNPHLLDNGHVLDASGGDVNGFPGLKEVDWNGNTVWQYTEPRAGYTPHHDFLRIYNSKLGAYTTLYLAAKSIAAADCLAAGCNPANGAYTNAQVDAIVEVDMSGNVVWEWCFFDHGIQDFDASKANYVGAGKTITNYPGRLNLNLPGRPITNDWLHCNSIDYSTNLDQIVINAAGGEFYVVDHGNTFVAGDPSGSLALAAGAKGDFLYRFGDPARYGQGNPPSIQQNWSSSTTGNKQIGGSSHAQWIPAGCPGAGHFLVFNNGGDLFETTPQSYVFEINGYLNATTNDTGVYVNPPSAGYYTWAPPGHDTDKKNKFMSRQIVWMYYSMANQGMFSHLDSGAQRLPNGNTLVCASTEGHVFEITATGEAVWEYVNPVSTEGIIAYKRDAWPMQNALFRAYRYPANHPALVGRTLTPRDTITGGLPSYLSAPSISGTSQAPATPLATNGVWVTSTVTNNGAVASVTLTYIHAGTTNTLAMADDGLHQDGAAGDGVYGAQIPALAAGTTVRYSIAAQNDFGLKATDPLSPSASPYSYTVQGTASLLAPVIASVTKTPATPTSTDSVWVTAQVTDDVTVSKVTLTYSTGTGGGGAAQTNSVFLETMRPTAVKPWTGDGCGNAWTVSFAGNNPFEQRDGANYGTGNTNGLEFKEGTANLTDSMLAPTQALDTRGTSGFVEFWLWADGLNGTAGWTFQLDAGSGYVTRLSELTGSSHAWQQYHYDLAAGELVNGLKMRWQFRGGQTTNRIDLDQISVQVVTGSGSSSTQVAMLDDGTHHDGAAGDGSYGAQIPAFTAGTTVNYYLVAADSDGHTATNTVGAPASTLSYTVQAGQAPSNSWSMSKLPDTGQTQSYTTTFGEDSDYTINPPSLSANGDGTVQDNVTGLIWQQGDSGEMTWENALIYAQTNRVGGQSDWRLPTSHELFSILNHGKTNPALDTNIFTLTTAQYWWTGDVDPSDTNRIWAANAGGGIGPHPKTETLSAGGAKRFHARCVRGAAAPARNPIHLFANNGNGTVTDPDSGLTWQQAEVASAMSWENALQYAENLTLAGQTDWRLPNIKELQSLNDETLTGPSVDTNYFTAARSARYWSSTTEINGTNRAWFVDFQLGIIGYDSKLTNLLVRCVSGGVTNSTPSTNSFAPQFVKIPSGQYQMGDHYGFVDPQHPSDEIPLHTVAVDAFYMESTVLTVREYVDFLNSALAQGLVEVRANYVYGIGGTNIYCDTYGSDTNSRVQWTGAAFAIRDNRDLHPITGVRWFGAIAYCNWASARDGYISCYNLVTGDCDLAKTGYRLPTEAEWEYAARGGLYNPYGMFPWGSDTNTDGTLANWAGKSNPYTAGGYPWTTPVGFYNGQLHTKAEYGWPGANATYQTRNNANGFGLYDMSGNVWEWVNDWYGKDYYQYCAANSIVTNPPGPVTGDPMPDGQAYRGLRGGNWFNGEDQYGHGRVSNRDPSYYRGPGDPNGPWFHVGFRVVRGVVGTTVTTNQPPVIKSTAITPASPTPADPVWVMAQVTDDVAVSNVTLTYSTGTGSIGGAAQTNSVFLETMRPTAVKPWTGDGCSNAWTVSFAGNNPFEQRDGANYGTGNTNGLEFKEGTANLTDSMLAPTQALDTRGASGFVEFWLWADGLNGTAGWTFQLDSGGGYVTRLSELTGASHAWQPYHYDLQAGERINGLKMRWQFRGGQTTNRMDLDQISVKVVTGSGGSSSNVAMLDDGTHHDGAAGDGLYGAQIPALPLGTTVHYYLVATDSGGLASTHPAGAPASTLSYTVQTAITNSVITNQTVGLFLNTSNAWPGYTLMAPMHHTNTYLIDNAGQVVHQWASTYEPGRSAYLLTNGHLFRAGMIKSGGPSTGGGEGGRIEEFDWDGNLVWAIDYYSPNYIHHHDFKVLPNGNVLLLVAEKKTYAEVLAAGFNPSLLDPSVASQGYMLPDCLVEVTPTRPYGGTVVWEWHLWDHMIQDYDATKNNYGVVADHPERIDVNGPGNKIPQFWNHVNGIDYHPQLDQVMLSIRGNSELFVVDHQITTAQAASHAGGRYSKGGDILYRWGNPQQYNRGTSASQMLFQQHHTHWIETNCPGAGNILIFNNGIGRNYSTINEIMPPVDAAGNYTLAAGAAFGPSSSTWTYTSVPPTNFYSAEISGCQRLPNGNTLICEGVKGNLFEVTSAGQTVWRYLCPVTSQVLTQGDSIPVDPARSDQFMNAVFRVNRYGLDYPGLAGKDLTPRGTIEIDSDVTTPSLPVVDITNANAAVSYNVTTYAIGGTSNPYVVGTLGWTNALTGGVGILPTASSWQISGIALGIGANVITVWGDNASGTVASDSITITRHTGSTPVAEFTAVPTTGGAPLTVSLTDTSSGVITNRSWSLGDGTILNTLAASLSHTYRFPGVYTVQAIVSGPFGSGTNTQADLIVATSVSTVRDGIPDWWRALYFGGTGTTINEVSCATADPDGDGSVNFSEFLADTNPTSALSCFRVRSLANPLGVQVSFSSSANRTYSLYSCTNLTLGAWSAVAGQTRIAGTGGDMTLTTPPSVSTQQYFRIGVEMP